jgi:hypothetical protein
MGHKQYITVDGRFIITQSADIAKELVGCLKSAGYKRTEATDFSKLYGTKYSTTSPKEKRSVEVKYAPESSDNTLISSDDLFLILLSKGWDFYHESFSTKSKVMCKYVEEGDVEEAVDGSVETPELTPVMLPEMNSNTTTTAKTVIKKVSKKKKSKEY